MAQNISSIGCHDKNIRIPFSLTLSKLSLCCVFRFSLLCPTYNIYSSDFLFFRVSFDCPTRRHPWLPSFAGHGNWPEEKRLTIYSLPNENMSTFLTCLLLLTLLITPSCPGFCPQLIFIHFVQLVTYRDQTDNSETARLI